MGGSGNSVIDLIILKDDGNDNIIDRMRVISDHLLVTFPFTPGGLQVRFEKKRMN